MAKINTNSNVYTIIYACVMVIIVAFLLAFISSALKPAQDANVAIDKKNQILKSLGVRDLEKNQVEAKYDELIKQTIVFDADGQRLGDLDAFDVETKEIGEKFPVYQAVNADGTEVSVFPMKGRGLWGGLWGYLAVDSQGKVTGAYFDHESETAGLGALIKDEPFQSQFVGRPLYDPEGNVALTVVKKGEAKEETQVDGVTGATLTSKGVGEMLQTNMQAYIDVLRKSMGAQGLMSQNHEGCGHHGQCQKAEKCCDKPDCKCAEKKLCACKDGSCGDKACNCASDDKCCKRQECPCSSCEKIDPCQKHEGCEKHEGCQKHEGCPEHQGATVPGASASGHPHKCKSGNDCCKSGKCDKSGSCGNPGCKGDKACCGHK